MEKEKFRRILVYGGLSLLVILMISAFFVPRFTGFVGLEQFGGDIGEETYSTMEEEIYEVYVNSEFDETTEGWGVTHFDNINDALNLVQEDGNIYVDSGAYNENLIISKSINLIGDGWETTAIDGGGSGHVITINNSYINISGFMIKGSGTNWGDAGIYYLSGDYSTIEGNYILENDIGISLATVSPGNILKSNYIINSSRYGIYTNLWGTQDNLIYNNYFDNADNFYAASQPPSFADFNITKTSGTNILGGSYLGGNFWNDYSGNDRGDGFGDSAHNVQGSYYDYLPLMEGLPSPSVNILNPQNVSYNEIQTELEFSISGFADNCKYSLDGGITNHTIDCGENITGLNSGQGFSEWIVYASNDDFANSSSITFFVDSIAPEISFTSNTLENNTVFVGNHIFAEVEVLEENEKNITFYLFNETSLLREDSFEEPIREISWTGLEEGNYSYEVEVFDVVGNYNSTERRKITLVNNSAPVVSIINPEEKLYTENDSLNLTFTVFDNEDNLDSCWYNLNGGENISLGSGGVCQNATFNVSEYGKYYLNLYANDSEGLVGLDSLNFSVDVLGISLNISEPLGKKSSRLNIPLDYNVTGNNLTCWYNVKTSVGGIVLSNRTLEDCNASSFNVSTDGDYRLNLYVNNTLGSFNKESSQFSVETSQTSPPSSGGGGSSRGGGTISSETVGEDLNESIDESESPLISIDELSSVVFKSPGNKKVSVNVRNIGKTFLNECSLEGIGNYDSWISSSEVKDIAPGQSTSFSMRVTVPEETAFGKHNLEFWIRCKEPEKFERSSILLELLEEKLILKVLKFSKESPNEVKITYSLQDFSSIDHQVEVEILLFDKNNNPLAEKRETVTLPAGSEEIFEMYLKSNEEIRGEISLLVNWNSPVYSGFFKEDIFLGSSTMTGLARFDEGEMGSWIVGSILLLGFFVFDFFKIRSMVIHKRRKSRKKN